MGLCQSSHGSESGTTKRIDNSLKNDQLSTQKDVKLLLLGTGESGKSTIFKQIKIIQNNGYSPEERKSFVHVIRRHCLETFRDLCRGADSLGLFTSIEQARMDQILETLENQGLSDKAVELITEVWTTEWVQQAYKLKNQLQLADSAGHFLDSLVRIADTEYLPTNEDILQCRVRTTGVDEMKINVKDFSFRIVDVGGQRNERRKWIHCFEGVRAVMFVTAISEFDQSLFEDDTSNRLRESLQLFSEISNSRFFLETDIILFLNKQDIFAEKIGRVDPSVCFADYTGGKNYDNAIKFIESKFRALCHHQHVFVHVTNATSTDNISFVFNSVKELLIMENMSASGLV